MDDTGYVIWESVFDKIKLFLDSEKIGTFQY